MCYIVYRLLTYQRYYFCNKPDTKPKVVTPESPKEVKEDVKIAQNEPKVEPKIETKAPSQKVVDIPPSQKVVEPETPQKIVETPPPEKVQEKVEHKNEPETSPVKPKKRRLFRRAIIFLILFGTSIGILEYLKLSKTSIRDRFKEAPQPVFKDFRNRDADLIKRGQEERIKRIRETLNQEISEEFKDQPVDYATLLAEKEKEVSIAFLLFRSMI